MIHEVEEANEERARIAYVIDRETRAPELLAALRDIVRQVEMILGKGHHSMSKQYAAIESMEGQP